MKLRPDEITKVLRERIEQYQGESDVEEVGTVLQVGDGIARVPSRCSSSRTASPASR